MATTYHVRPSDLLGVRDNSYMAFSIDRAVWLFGISIEHDMDQAQNSPRLGKTPTGEQMTAARQAVYEQYMNVTDIIPVTPPPGRFADPMAAIRADRSGR